MDPLLVVKIAGEMGTKSSRTRRRFLRVLVRNVRAALERAGVRPRIEPRWSRVLVRVPADRTGAAVDQLARVFGVHSASEAAVLPAADLPALVTSAEALYRDRVAGRRFAVRSKRAGEHPYRSPDVAVALGRALLPVSAGVDLEDPEVEVTLEIAGPEAFALLDRRPGPGGLPVGTGGRALALFSGGFDSPVAAWMAMRRGAQLELLVCDLGGCGQVDAALGVARTLVTGWAPGVEPAAHVVDLAPVVAALRAQVAPSIRQVVLKRAMYRAGTLVAEATGAEALVTGESLGQVSTQTLRNLVVTEDAAGLPVLRPLIGMDKQEILARARQIGTHDASVLVDEHCQIATGRVQTAARLRDVVTAEGELDEGFIKDAVVARTTVDLVGWSPGAPPEHVVREVPEGAVIVDLREPGEGPDLGELRLPVSGLARWASTLDPDRTYLFVCTHGTRSEQVAHELRRRGLRTFSLAGGARGLPASA